MASERIELAQAVVPLYPSMRGIRGDIESELSREVIPAARKVGRSAGLELDTGMADGMRNSRGMGAAIGGLGKDLGRAGAQLGVDLGKQFAANLNLAGPIDREGKKIGATAQQIGVSFIAGFRDADAAASSFTGRMGTYGGRVRAITDKMGGNLATNFVAGFREADAAASSFTGRMGTLGGKTRDAVDVATRPLNNFKTGFTNAEGAASSFTGYMGTFGGKVRSATDTAAGGFTALGGKLKDFGGRTLGVFNPALDGVERFKRGLSSSKDAVDPLTGKLGSLGGQFGRLGSSFSTFGSGIKTAITNAGSEFKTGMGRFKEQAAAAGKESGDSFSSRFGGALKVGLAGIGGVALLSGLTSSITKAGDLEQSLGAVDAVFKENSGQVHAWAKGAVTNLGLSENAYNEFATVLGASLKNAGTPMDQLGGKTNGLITLGADLASMYGGTTAEAIDAVSAALRGEMDPIERYGISLNDAALTQEGMAMGIEKTGGAFTDQQKKLIIQSLLMKQSADAQGNFNREQDTYAHKLQVAGAQWDNLSTKMGEVFLPMASSIMGWLGNTAMPILDEFVGGLRAFGAAWTANDEDITSSGFPGMMEQLAFTLHGVYDWLSGTSQYWGPFAAGIAIVAGAFGLYQGVLAAVTFFQGAWAAALAISTGAEVAATGATYALGSAIAFLMSPVTLIVVGIGLLVGALILAYNHVGWFRDLVNTAWAWIQLTISNFVSWWTTVAWPTILTGLQIIGQWFVMLWQNYVVPAWNGIIAVIQWAWTAIIQPIFNAIVWVIQNFLAPIFMWLWQNIIVPVFNGIVAVISWAWNTIILPLFNMVVAVVRDILAPIFIWLWQNIIVPAWNAISAIISWAWNSIIKPIFTAIVWILQNIVGPVFTWLWQNIVTPVFNGIRIVIEVAWAAIQIIFWAIHAFITKILGPVFIWFWDNVISPVWNWISDKISGTWYWLRDNILNPIGTYLSTKFMDFWTSARDGIGKVWDGIKDIVKAPIKFVVDTVINDGLIAGYNKLNDFWEDGNNGDIPRIGLGFARGGVIPGYQSQKKDEVLTPMRRGEGVLVPEATRVLGHSFIYGINNAANASGTSGASSWLAQNFGQGYARGGVISPLKQRYPITQGYNRVHKGIDIGAPEGTPIYATADGRVSHAGPGARAPGVWGGNEIHITSGGIERWFAHLSQIAVSVGQQVKQGDYIGKTGNTGISSGAHLHFGVFQGGWPNDINPLDYLGGAVNFDASASGGGGGIISHVIDGFANLLDAPIKAAKDKFGGNGWVNAPIGIAEHALTSLKDFAVDKVQSLFGSDEGSGGDIPTADGGGNVDRWRGTIVEALQRTGLPTSGAYIDAWLRQVQSESGGNPNAMQHGYVDVNTGGNEAAGLLQVTKNTWNAYRDPSLPNNRFDPLASAVAGMRWAKAAYGIAGMLNVIGHGHGYRDGGFTGYGNPNEIAGFVHKGEYVIPADATAALMRDYGKSSLERMRNYTGSSVRNNFSALEQYAKNNAVDKSNSYHIESIVAADPNAAIRALDQREQERKALALG